ncbi:unnamed protein product [Gemmata massiliana]|uniref:Uncharacterized protein n=1 Tax=Gemmata massiliana TaxID=1210884 RepID=A0A6P2CVY3_9BACT|nr:unnamed protein product [Gemmata massiliana]
MEDRAGAFLNWITVARGRLIGVGGGDRPAELLLGPGPVTHEDLLRYAENWSRQSGLGEVTREGADAIVHEAYAILAKHNIVWPPTR